MLEGKFRLLAFFVGLSLLMGCMQQEYPPGITYATVETTSTTSSTLITIDTISTSILEETPSTNASFGDASTTSTLEERKRTFNDNGGIICTEKGKPIIRLYSTNRCPHCLWVKDTFDKVAKEYVSAGKIVAYHWDLEAYDDILTPPFEGSIPQKEINMFLKDNPLQRVPKFDFGCKYYRLGNGYELQNDLKSEEKEIREVIDELINSTANANKTAPRLVAAD